MSNNTRRLYDQVMAIFGVFMTFFYIGIGLFFITTKSFPGMEEFIRYFVGGMFVLYGIYRVLQSYHRIKEAFFSRDED